MEVFIHTAAEYVSLGLDAIAVFMVAMGSVLALLELIRASLHNRLRGESLRAIFIGFARWLIAALTFQLGSDIVNTTLEPTWDEIGRLASIAVIRTFLTFFLDRDLVEARETQHRAEEEAARTSDDSLVPRPGHRT